jgi:hypothetical protein
MGNPQRQRTQRVMISIIAFMSAIALFVVSMLVLDPSSSGYCFTYREC